jgi:hypothetical protein
MRHLLTSCTSGSHLGTSVDADASEGGREMRRGVAIAAVIVTILAGIGIGVGALPGRRGRRYQAGIEQVQTAQETGQDVQFVHVVGDGPRGFFPGFLLFPLFLVGGFFLIGGDRAGRATGDTVPGGPGPGPWNDEGRRRFEERAREWHRHEHGEPFAGPLTRLDSFGTSSRWE